MADPRFFDKSDSITLGELVTLSECDLSEGISPDILINDVAALSDAGEGEISFLDNSKYKSDFEQTSATACIVSPKFQDLAPNGVALLLSDNPYKSYALTAQYFYPLRQASNLTPQSEAIHSSAKIGKDCVIETGAVIKENAEIGDGCIIGTNTVIERGVVIGNHCDVGANVTISHTIMGNGVCILPGARIGQDGFGFAIDPKTGHVTVPQLGRVMISDGVHIGANTTIDRGAGPDTTIGPGARIDNLVQLGHNVQVGAGAVIVAQVGVSGSSKIGNFAVLGGQVGVAGHLNVGQGAQVAAQSGVSKDIPAGQTFFGSPARPIKEAWRALGVLNRLAKKGT